MACPTHFTPTVLFLLLGSCHFNMEEQNLLQIFKDEPPYGAWVITVCRQSVLSSSPQFIYVGTVGTYLWAMICEEYHKLLLNHSSSVNFDGVQPIENVAAFAEWRQSASRRKFSFVGPANSLDGEQELSKCSKSKIKFGKCLFWRMRAESHLLWSLWKYYYI